MGQEDNTTYDHIISQLDALATRMAKMESTVAELDKRTAISDVILGRVEESFSRNVQVLSRTTEAINSIEKTMISLQDQINMNQQVTIAIKDKVDMIESSFQSAEEKSKIDFREVVKDFFKSKIGWVISGGFILSILNLIAKIIENFDKISALFK